MTTKGRGKIERGYLSPAQRSKLEDLLRLQASGWRLWHDNRTGTFWMAGRPDEYQSVHKAVAMSLVRREMLTILTQDDGLSSFTIHPFCGKRGVDNEGYPI